MCPNTTAERRRKHVLQVYWFCLSSGLLYIRPLYICVLYSSYCRTPQKARARRALVLPLLWPLIYASTLYLCSLLILLPNAAENTCSKCGGSTSLAAHRAYGERRSQACQYLYFCTSKASKLLNLYLSCGAPMPSAARRHATLIHFFYFLRERRCRVPCPACGVFLFFLPVLDRKRAPSVFRGNARLALPAPQACANALLY